MDDLYARLSGLARSATHRADVIVAIFMLLAVAMMIVPLPTLMVDMLIAFNISASLLVLVTSFYIGRPAAFSSLPPIILLATLFRLALSISTTRLILLHGDAGRIVETFGRFVIGGEVVVGLVIFLIITAAQFLVITKGAERVAEVAARFTLDAMPGKQMAIDNDLRAGDIDQVEARARRGRLERESQLYGAMDGAMKFVKGDAITGLIIIFVNLLGGLLIGMMQRGMSFGEASHTYSLLTVGDGLIAQIPALLISMAAGTAVTRIANDENEDLGTEIVRQLGSSQRALTMAALVIAGAAFIPGFPAFIFLAIGAAFGGGAYILHRRSQAASALDASGQAEAPAVEALLDPAAEPLPVPRRSAGPTRTRIVAHAGTVLSATLARFDFEGEIDRVRRTLQEELGVEMPAIELRADATLGADTLRIDLESVPLLDARIPADRLMVDDDPVHLDLIGLAAEEGPTFEWAPQAGWVEANHRDVLRDAGIAVLAPIDVLGRCIAHVLRRHAAHFIGMQETREWLAAAERDFPDVVQEIMRMVPLQKLSDVLRRLVEEEVPIVHARIILEAMVEQAARDADVHALTERARGALCRQICHRHARFDRVIITCVLTRDVEQVVRNGMKRRGTDVKVSLAPDYVRAIPAQLRPFDDEAAAEPVVMLVAADIRRAFRNFLVQNGLHRIVLSYQEIAPDYAAQSVGTIAAPAHQQNGAAAPAAPADDAPANAAPAGVVFA